NLSGGAGKPHRDLRTARGARTDPGGSGVVVDQGSRKAAAGIPQPLPLLTVGGGDVGIGDEQSVVDLGAQPGRGPVRAPGPHGARRAVSIGADQELVVTQRTRGNKPVSVFDVDTGGFQLGP